MTNLDSILKSRDITWPTKVHIVKAMVFPVVMCGCESWIIKKAECPRINVFELCYWRKVLRVPWTARRSSQSILKEINPGYSLEGLMSKLKVQYFCHLRRRADSLEKTLMLGKIEGRRRRGWLRMKFWMDSGNEFEHCLGNGEGQGSLAYWGRKKSDMIEWLNNNKRNHVSQIINVSYFNSKLFWIVQYIFSVFILQIIKISTFQTLVLFV